MAHTDAFESENKGDLHEAFNLGLDPSIFPEIKEEAGPGLKHSENLWPKKQDWEGAETFVSE